MTRLNALTRWFQPILTSFSDGGWKGCFASYKLAFLGVALVRRHRAGIDTTASEFSLLEVVGLKIRPTTAEW